MSTSFSVRFCYRPDNRRPQSETVQFTGKPYMLATLVDAYFKTMGRHKIFQLYLFPPNLLCVCVCVCVCVCACVCVCVCVWVCV